MRASDRAFRVGGDEFALLLVGAGPTDAQEAIARLVFGLAEGSTEDARLSASFGSAVYPDDGTTATQLINVADSRLYAAKRGD